MLTTADAANLTYVKDTLSDSAPSSVSNHEIEFLSPSGVDSGETIVVTFPAGFDLTGVNETDIDLIDGVTQETLVAAAPGATEWSAVVSGQAITFTSGGASATIGALSTTTIRIGTNATGGVANAQITNPAATTSYQIDITAGSGADTGTAMVAIIENVLVTADVDSTLSFVVSGTPSATAVNGTTTTETSTNVSIPFGTLSSGEIKTIAQDLSVQTNARNGYVVTVEQDGNLQSSTGADIDGFIDGNYLDIPDAWVSPSSNINNENTWGHWGLTSDDTDLHGAGNDFGPDEWVAASTTPRAVMAHTGPSDGTTQDIGAARVGYQIEITALQEAGDDYNTTLTYIATPTF
jgi:hypothetical protein